MDYVEGKPPNEKLYQLQALKQEGLFVLPVVGRRHFPGCKGGLCLEGELSVGHVGLPNATTKYLGQSPP